MAIQPHRPLTPSQPPAKANAASPVTLAATAPSEQIAADGIQTSPPAQGPIPSTLPAILKFSTLPDQAHYQQAVAELQKTVDADLALQDRSVPRDLYLRQNYQTMLLTQPQASAKGTVLMLHGYTAGPWQFAEAAERFHKAGYQVYAPRLPGHGLMKPDGMPTGEKMVAPGHEDEYEKFIDTTYADVKALGGPVHVVGLSGGGGLALRMAEKHPEIKGLVAMSPFVGPNESARIANNVLNEIARHSFVNVPAVLNLIPYHHNVRVTGADLPHTQGSLGNAQAMISLGTRVEKITVPTQFFTTEGDLLSGSEPVGKLFERSGGSQHNGWFHFNAAAKVPHAMASPRQFAGASAIWDKVFATIEEGHFEQKKPDGVK